MKSCRFYVFACVCAHIGALSLWAQDPGTFDNSNYAKALAAYVDDQGMVNYRDLKANPQDLNAYVQALAALPPGHYAQWSDEAKIAFWINAYNGLTLKTVINHYPIQSSFLKSRIYPKNSIRQIAGVWDKITYRIMGQDLSLDHIEHKILRIEFKEARIHMALVCAAASCPKLRNEPYEGLRLDAQLEDQSRLFLCCRSKLKIARTEKLIYLSPIFKWFARDFVSQYRPLQGIGRHSQENQAVLNFVSRYLNDPFKSFLLAGDYTVKYLDYDWSLNEQ